MDDWLWFELFIVPVLWSKQVFYYVLIVAYLLVFCFQIHLWEPVNVHVLCGLLQLSFVIMCVKYVCFLLLTAKQMYLRVQIKATELKSNKLNQENNKRLRDFGYFLHLHLEVAQVWVYTDCHLQISQVFLSNTHTFRQTAWIWMVFFVTVPTPPLSAQPACGSLCLTGALCLFWFGLFCSVSSFSSVSIASSLMCRLPC